MSTNRILVTGATGQQGGATIRSLLTSGRSWQLRALVRDPNSDRALALVHAGVEVMPGNLDDEASIQAALAGVDGVFSVQSPQEGGPEAEERQGKLLATVAATVGVKHFVYTSAGGADRNTGIPHFESKWRIEQYIRHLGLPATVLRPAAFMENFATFSFRTIILSMWKTYVPENRAIQLVAVEDIGRFAARAFAEPERSIGQAVELAGDAVTRREVLRALRRHKLTPALSLRFPKLLRPRLPHEYVVMFKWMASQGFQADVPSLRRIEPRLQSMESWADTARLKAVGQQST